MAGNNFDWSAAAQRQMTFAPEPGAAGAPSAPAPSAPQRSPIDWDALNAAQMRLATPPVPEAPTPTVAPDAPWYQRAWTGARNLVTGEDRTEFPDLPELTSAPGFSGAGLRTAAGYTVTREPEQMRGAIERAYPGASFVQDRYGNDIVSLPNNGGRYYVNKPGASTADLMQVPAMGVEAFAAMRGGKLGGSTPTRMLGGALGGGAGALAVDVAAAGVGGAPDLVDAATHVGIGAATGGAGEALVPAVQAIRGAWARFGSRGMLIDQSGNLTATGRAVMDKAGIDAAAYTREQLQQIVEAVRGAGTNVSVASERAAAAATQARAGEFGIPHTVGQQSGNLAQLSLEDSLRHGGLPGGQETMRAFDTTQREAVDAATRSLRERLTGNTGAPRGEADVGQVIRDRTVALRDQRAAQTDALYDRVGPLGTPNGGRQVVFDGASFDRLRTSLDAVTTDILVDPTTTPQAAAIIGRMRSVTEGAELSLGQAEQLRRQAGAAVNGATNAADRAAAIRAKAALDDWMDAALERSLYSGDEAAVQALREARAHARGSFEMFSPDNAPRRVTSLMERALQNGATGQEVSNVLLGSGQIGTAEGTRAAVQHLETMFGRTSPVFSAVREGALQRVFQGTANSAEDQTYRMMSKRLNDALAGRGSEVMGALFSDAERATLRRYADELGHLAETTIKQNASGTAYKASQIVRQVMGMALGASFEGATGGMTGGVAGVVGGSIAARGAGSVMGGMQARQATQGTASLAALPVSDLVRMSLQMGTNAAGRSQTDGR